MKKKLIYKIISGLTLVLPLSVYLIIMATVFRISHHARIYANHNEVTLVERMHSQYILVDESIEEFSARGQYYNGEVLISIAENEIFLFNDGYFTLINDKWADADEAKQKEDTSWKIPFTVFVSLGGIVIVGLVISGKMEFHKKFPRVATLISLILGTLILSGISAIVKNLADVFLIATLSWAVYMIEHAIYKGVVSGEKVKEIKSVLDNELDDALKGLK